MKYDVDVITHMDRQGDTMWERFVKYVANEAECSADPDDDNFMVAVNKVLNRYGAENLHYNECVRFDREEDALAFKLKFG